LYAASLWVRIHWRTVHGFIPHNSASSSVLSAWSIAVRRCAMLSILFITAEAGRTRLLMIGDCVPLKISASFLAEGRYGFIAGYVF